MALHFKIIPVGVETVQEHGYIRDINIALEAFSSRELANLPSGYTPVDAQVQMDPTGTFKAWSTFKYTVDKE